MMLVKAIWRLFLKTQFENEEREKKDEIIHPSIVRVGKVFSMNEIHCFCMTLIVDFVTACRMSDKDWKIATKNVFFKWAIKPIHYY